MLIAVCNLHLNSHSNRLTPNPNPKAFVFLSMTFSKIIILKNRVEEKFGGGTLKNANVFRKMSIVTLNVYKCVLKDCIKNLSQYVTPTYWFLSGSNITNCNRKSRHLFKTSEINQNVKLLS